MEIVFYLSKPLPLYRWRGPMLRIDHALRSDRVLKALTGLSILEFIDLRDRFATVRAHRHRPDPGTATATGRRP